MMKKILKTFFRCVGIAFIIIFFLFVTLMIYGELLEREEADRGYPSVLNSNLLNFSYIAANYLADNPDPERGINLMNKLEPYVASYSESYSYLPRLKSGRYALYMSGDITWLGFALPEIFFTRGKSRTRQKIQETNERMVQQHNVRPYYGSGSLDSPPSDNSEQYRYRQEDDVVWLQVYKKNEKE
jgi:hypothetical protein